MRNRKYTVLIINTMAAIFMILLTYSIGFGQQEKVYVVINEASWCKYCKAHSERVNKVIHDFSAGKEILIIHRDITDKNTSKKYDPTLKSLRIYEYMNGHKEAAMVYVFNSKTNKVIDGFRLKSDDAEIVTILKRSMEKVQANPN
jgi:hypothetical protein